MELYKKYAKEKYNRDVIFDEYGFIEYECFTDGSMYIYTLFVSEEGRNKGQGKDWETKVIEKHNPHTIYCDIEKDSSNWILALVQICKKADYNVYEDNQYRVILKKEIKVEKER